MTTVKKLVEHLQKAFKPEDVLAVAIWQADDVISRAREQNKTISKEQAEEIIDRIDRKQDASLGITWDTIDCYVDDLDEQEEM